MGASAIANFVPDSGSVPVHMSTSCSQVVVVANKMGLHARPAMHFVETASRFKSQITVRKNDYSVDGKSIMEMLTLAAACGTQLEVLAVGDDAEDAVAALAQLVAMTQDP